MRSCPFVRDQFVVACGDSHVASHVSQRYTCEYVTAACGHVAVAFGQGSSRMHSRRCTPSHVTIAHSHVTIAHSHASVAACMRPVFGGMRSSKVACGTCQ